MATLIFTAEEAYNKFLIDVRMVYTGQVTPEQFNWFWNDGQLEWVQSKLPLNEFNQKRIDDIECLRTITDGTQIGHPLIPYHQVAGTFMLPNVYASLESDGLLYAAMGLIRYPLYLHGLLASFKDTATDEIFSAWLLRSDQKAISRVNPYRMPKHTRPLYEYINGHVRLMGRDSEAMVLEYYRYPKLMRYDETTSNNIINPEFNPSINKEITDIAVKRFLENRQNPRYKSTLQEMMIRARQV